MIEKNFELHVADKDATSGTVPIAWCISKEMLEDLHRAHIREPQVVIVITQEGDAFWAPNEQRRIVPLKDLMAYIELQHPGKNRIHGFISPYGPTMSKNRFLARSYGKYDSDVLFSSGSEVRDDIAEHSHSITVDVPRECFAKEPSAWEKSWVNHFFQEKAVDQCNFRRRRLFAYLIQPIIMLVAFTLRLMMLTFSLLIGGRGLVHWRSTYRLLSEDMDDAFRMVKGGTFFIRKFKEEDDPGGTINTPLWLLSHIWALPLMPLISLPIGFICLTYGAVFILSMIGAILSGVIGILALAALIIWAIIHLPMKAKHALYDFFRIPVDKTGPVWYLDQKELDLLVCDGRQKPTQVGKLPSRHRTIKLRYQQLKSKVCKPFSR